MSPECAAGHHNCCTDEELTEDFDCGCQCHDEMVLELVVFDGDEQVHTFQEVIDKLKKD